MTSAYSIEKQLTFRTAISAITIFLVALLIVDKVIVSWLKAEFDQNLTGKAVVTATLIKDHEQGLEFDFADEIMPEFERRENPEYFQIWIENQGVFERSKSLGDVANLAASNNWKIGSYFRNITLVDGRRGRQIELVLQPQIVDKSRRTAAVLEKQHKVRLILARERESLDQLIYIIHGALLGGCLVFGVIICLQMRLIIRRSLRPLNQLSEQIHQLDPQRIEQRINIGSCPHELSLLVEQFNQALTRIEQSIHREQRFTADVAHELRTPISELLTMAEVATRWKDSTNYDQVIQDVLDISRQMQTTTNNLLALARSDKGAVALEPGEYDLKQALNKIIDKFTTAANLKNIKIIQQFDNYKLTILTSKIELELVLTNIIDNAVEYAEPNSAVSIIHSGQTLTVSNYTQALQQEDMAVIFQRLWRKDKARSSSTHSGLGMALIKSYAEQLNLEVSATLDQQQLFSIHLSGLSVVTSQ
jgi:signal transduction histidine kinase